MFAKKSLDLPTADTALPGRPHPLPTAETHFINGNPLKGPYPDGLETVYFAMGCFWGVERVFWQIPGVWVTAVGYQQGLTPNATYEEVCSGRTGHTESVLVVFDPKVPPGHVELRHQGELVGEADFPWSPTARKKENGS